MLLMSLLGAFSATAYSLHHPILAANDEAALMAKLMARLERVPYVVQGGDWGSIIASFFPVVDPDNCLGG